MSYLNLVHLLPLFMSTASPHIQNLKLMARDANPWHRASDTKQSSIVRDIWHVPRQKRCCYLNILRGYDRTLKTNNEIVEGPDALEFISRI